LFECDVEDPRIKVPIDLDMVRVVEGMGEPPSVGVTEQYVIEDQSITVMEPGPQFGSVVEY
jgi:hypothetical protein